MVRLVIGLNTEESIATVPGNVNFDHAINLIDFSIISLWYGKRNPPASVDLNGDNKVDLADLSILAFYWTN